MADLNECPSDVEESCEGWIVYEVSHSPVVDYSEDEWEGADHDEVPSDVPGGSLSESTRKSVREVPDKRGADGVYDLTNQECDSCCLCLNHSD